MSTPLISAVIITRHRPKPLENCLRTLAPFCERGLETIIVDNSDDDATEQVAKRFPWTTYVRVPHSKNFQTATRNRGLRMARAPIAAFLDDDVTVKPTWFDACLDGYKAEDTGAVGGRVLDPEVEGNDYFRQAPICTILPDGRLTDNLECDPGKIVQVQHLRGCNYSVRKDAALAAGGFDEHLIDYGFEDLDLLLRIQKRGGKVLFNPKMEVYHYIVPREKRDRYDKSFRQRYITVRNLCYVYAKSLPTVTARYILTGDTGLRALAVKPSRRMLSYVMAGLTGKIAGLFRYIVFHLFRSQPA